MRERLRLITGCLVGTPLSLILWGAFLFALRGLL